MSTVSDIEIHLLQDLISSVSGLRLSQSQSERLKKDVNDHIKSKNLNSFQHFYHILKADQKTKNRHHINELLSIVTNNETYFFRNPSQFEALESAIIPKLVQTKEDKKIRIWSAGCSTGPEPYSIAIILSRNSFMLKDWSIEILATDIDYQCLDLARDGIYNKRALNNMSPQTIRRYFRQKGNNYELVDEIKNLVNFSYSNLQEIPYPKPVNGKWDVIFCRNVIIYFDAQQKNYVIENLHGNLTLEGYLFLGHSESLLGITDSFQPIDCAGAHLYQRKKLDRTSPELRKPKQLDKKIRSGNTTSTIFPPNQADNEIQVSVNVTEEKQKYKNDLIQDKRTSHLVFKSLITKGQMYADQGQYEVAANFCQRAIELQHNNFEARFLMASVLEQLGSLDQAIYEYKQTILFNPVCIMARLKLGGIYASQGEYDKSKKEYTKSLSLLRNLPLTEDVQFSGGFSVELLVNLCTKRLAEVETIFETDFKDYD